MAQVTKDSPAAKAGLKVGDLIVRYRGKAVTEVGEFRNRVALTPPGDKVKLNIIRKGKPKTLRVKIGKLDDKPLLAKHSSSPSVYTADKIGLTVQTISPALAGIQTGTIILQVNREMVNSAEAFKQTVAKSQADKRVLLLLSNRGMSRYVVLSWQ